MRRIATLVRCLECGTEYDLEVDRGEAEPCPHCGGVGWIAVDADGREEKNS
jgi:rRNA maturation endonuclease Nob1